MDDGFGKERFGRKGVQNSLSVANDYRKVMELELALWWSLKQVQSSRDGALWVGVPEEQGAVKNPE